MNQNLHTLKYVSKDIDIDVKISFSEKTVWLTLDQMATLFSRDRSVIGKQVKKFFEENTLESAAVRAKFAHTGPDGKTYEYNYYNLDLILTVGSRINATITNEFKEWAYSALYDGNSNVLANNSLQSSEIVKYTGEDFELDVTVSPKEDTVWLDENQLALLFHVGRRTINFHINNILNSGELDNSTWQKNFQARFYNLDMIISVGYRVNSKKGIAFRRWANSVLKQYLLKGYIISDNRCTVCHQSIYELSNRVSSLEHQANHQIEFNADETLKGFLSIKRYLESAKESILIIDNYFDDSFDDVLKNIKASITIITNPKNSKIQSNEIYKVLYSNNFHDRYIFVDDICYISGQSIKDIGKKISCLTRIYDIIQEDILRKI